MTALSNERLLELNSQGLIPGPEEDEAAFLDRVERCLHLKETIVTELKDHVPFIQDELCSQTLLAPALKNSQHLYGIIPEWIPLFFSNHQLQPWHGGCAWICQVEKNSPPIAFLQLRREFASRDRFMAIYQRDELITHELSHVGRMTFHEPQFEEILAYRSAGSPTRSWVGPLLQSSYEALFLFGLLLVSVVIDLFALIDASPHSWLAAQWWKVLPLGYLAILTIRLIFRQRCFKRCRLQLIDLLKDENLADSVLYRLTDSEIRLFSQISHSAISEYVRTQASQSLRWKLLNLAYFSSQPLISDS